jgi:hypothetical protein
MFAIGFMSDSSLITKVYGYSNIDFYNLKSLNILISKIFLVLAGLNIFFWFYFSKLVEYDEKQTRILTFSFIYLIITSVSHFLLSTKKVSTIYYRDLGREFNRFRWVEYSLTSSIMMIIYGMLVDITNPALLISLFCLNTFAMISAGFGDQYKFTYKHRFWIFSAIAVGFYFLQWIIILIHIINNFDQINITNIYIIAYMFITFLFFPLIFLLQMTHYFKDKYMFIEKYFVAISLVSKSILLFSLFFLI